MTDRWWLHCPKCNEFFFTADFADQGFIYETCENCKTKLKIDFRPTISIIKKIPKVKIRLSK